MVVRPNRVGISQSHRSMTGRLMKADRVTRAKIARTIVPKNLITVFMIIFPLVLQKLGG
jgi:hypothetical protein